MSRTIGFDFFLEQSTYRQYVGLTAFVVLSVKKLIHYTVSSKPLYRQGLVSPNISHRNCSRDCFPKQKGRINFEVVCKCIQVSEGWQFALGHYFFVQRGNSFFILPGSFLILFWTFSNFIVLHFSFTVFKTPKMAAQV